MRYFFCLFSLLFSALASFASEAEVLSIDSIYSKAVESFQKGDNEQALHYLIECSEQAKLQYGDTSLYYRDMITECGYCCINMGRYEDAINYELIAYQITEPNPQEHIKSVRNLIDYYGDLGNFELVSEYLNELKSLNDQVYSTPSELAEALIETSDYYKAINDFDQAEQLIRRAISIDENNHEKNIIRHFSLFECLKSSHKYDEAIIEGEANLKKLQQNIEPTDSTFSICGVLSMMLAECYESIGNYLSTIDLNEQALRIFENTLGTYDIKTAEINSLLANNYYKIGAFSKAIEFEKQTIEILSTVVGQNNSRYALALSNLAFYSGQIGMNVEALNSCEEALRIQRNLTNDNEDYLFITSNLAYCFAALGNYEKAIELTQQVLDIQSILEEENIIEIARSLNNLATYISHQDDGDMNKAISYQEDCVRILEEIAKENDKESEIYYVDALSNLAVLFDGIGRSDTALYLLEECIRLYDSIGSLNNYNRALLYYNIANVYAKTTEYDKVIEYLTEAYSIMTIYGQTNVIEYIYILSGLYSTCLRMGDTDGVIHWMREMEKANSNQVENNLPYLTSRERSLFWELLSDWYNIDMPKCLKLVDNEEISGDVYNSLLMSKGILLGTEVEINKFLRNTQNSRIIYEIGQEKLLLENSVNELSKTEIDSLNQSINQKERFLLKNSGIDKMMHQYYSIRYQDIRTTLKENEIAIEFMTSSETDKDTCYAVCLKNHYSAPHIVQLTNMSELGNKSQEDLLSSDCIEGLVWNPLKEELSDVHTIYFAPSGVIHLLPIESAPIGNSKIMSELYNIYRLSSTRELVNNNEYHLKNAVIYGGIDYDATSDELLAANNDLVISPPQEFNSNLTAMRSLKESSLRAGCSLLEGSRREAEFISNELRNAGIAHIIFKDSKGTEESFKALSGHSPSLLHIGTHGFYWTQDMAERHKKLSDNLYFLRDNDKKVFAEDKALSRSGLMMAGCNRVFNDETLTENLEDGILTAKEISQLDLRGLSLVVLSACETALGDISGSEGVFGLQRAFKKAGAQSIMMSLWKVDDIATENMMKSFYNHLLKGESVRQSFLSAQQELRAIDPEPAHWAAFILLDALD